MIDFESRKHMGAAGYSYAEKLKEMIKWIDELLLQDRKSKLELGWALLELWNSRCYCESPYARQDSLTLSGRAFFAVLEGTFDIPKTTACQLINVVDEFCQEAPPELDVHWRPFSYSALVEMLSLTPSQRQQIAPTWSVRRIREFKKNLLATGPGTSEEVFHNRSDVGTPVENSDSDTLEAVDGAAEPDEGTPVSSDIRASPSYKYYLMQSKETLAVRIVTLEIEQRELIRIINESGIEIEPDNFTKTN